MADTPRSRADLLVLFADNVVGAASVQDFRDFLVTVMEEEFVNAGDFWKQPSPAQITVDKTGRGWTDYSQIIDSACSFGNVMQLTPSETWNHFISANSDRGIFGIALDSYASAESQAQILRCGLIKDSSLSSLSQGKTLYADSASFIVTHTRQSDVYILGIAEGTDTYRFWPVCGKVASE